MSEFTGPLETYESADRWDNIADEIGHVATCRTEEQARRIVACVNACKNIPIETLEDGGVEFALAKAGERAEEAEWLLRDGEWVVRNILSGLSTDPNQDQDETWAHAKHRARLFLDAARAHIDRRPK